MSREHSLRGCCRVSSALHATATGKSRHLVRLYRVHYLPVFGLYCPSLAQYQAVQFQRSKETAQDSRRPAVRTANDGEFLVRQRSRLVGRCGIYRLRCEQRLTVGCLADQASDRNVF